jgi:hypothetical protein
MVKVFVGASVALSEEVPAEGDIGDWADMMLAGGPAAVSALRC